MDSVTFLFAEDLRQASEGTMHVLFLDAYEALVPTPTRSGRGAMADVWLRDLLGQLDRGMSVVASREPLNWHVYQQEWADIIRVVHLDALPMSARRELLTGYGIQDTSEVTAVASASEGVPFYLHLAVDTRLNTDGRARSEVVSSEEILQRFLHNVNGREVHTLELLSVPRVFDFDLYRAIAQAHQLPADRVTWESLTAYSFIHSSEGNSVRLHQLMRSSLRERLSREVRQEIAILVAELWHQRAETEMRQEEPAFDVVTRATRETVYSLLQAGSATGEWIIARADTALDFGGRPGLEGIVAELRDHLDSHPEAANDDLKMTSLCLVSCARSDESKFVTGLLCEVF